jgi:hypothetical protein
MKYYTLAAILLCYTAINAQQTSTKYRNKTMEETSKGWIGGAIGANFPVGAIANTDPLSQDAGLATTGFHFNLNMGYKISGPIGICVLLHGSANKINEQAFESFLSRTMPTGSSGTYTVKPWAMGGLLAGPYFNLLSFGGKSFYIRGLIGYANVTTPETSITVNTPGNQSITATTHSDEFTGFSYSIGSGLNIQLGKKVQLMLNMDFITTTVTVKDIKTSVSNGASYTLPDSYKQPYSIITLTGGIAYIIPETTR